MEYNIDKNITLPKERNPGRPAKYPFASMVVGDSFDAGEYSAILMRTLSSTAYAHGKPLGKKFSCRKIDGKLRVWRIK